MFQNRAKSVSRSQSLLPTLKVYFHFLLFAASGLHLSLCQPSQGLLDYNMDGKYDIESEPWPDTLSPAEQKELERTSEYYEDAPSIVANLVADAGELQDDEEEAASASEVVIEEGGTVIAKVAQVTCSQTQIQTQISKGKKAISNAVALLTKAQAQKAATVRCSKLLKWMLKWLNDVGGFLTARNFNKASNKLKAVTNNLGYAQKLATKPASDLLLAAIPEVRALKTLTDSLSRCVAVAPLQVQNLPSSPVVTVPNPTPYASLTAVANPGNAQIDGTDFNLKVDGKADKVRVKSLNSFTSGVFTVSYKCPKSFGGLITSFNLASSDEFTQGDGILYEVLGNHPDRVRVGFMVAGKLVNAPAIDLGLDCSEDFHQYTIIWEANSIKWLFDGEILRHMDRNDPNTRLTWLTATEMNVYAGIRRYYGWGVGTYTAANAPFVASFMDLKITSPISPKTMPAIPSWPRSSYPLTKFGIDYARDSLTRLPANNEVVFPFSPDQSWYGGRIVSPKRYNFGEFSALIRCPTGNASGLVTSFYLSTIEGGSRFRIQDEIDFEFLGKNHKSVQFTYFVNGKAIHAVVVPLGYDCSEDFHEYTIRWTSTKIEWLVDNEVRHVSLNDGVTPFPTRPSYLYASLWNGDNGWAGKYFGKDAPYIARYRNITMLSPLS